MQVVVTTQPSENDPPLHPLQAVPTGTIKPNPFIAGCRQEAEKLVGTWEKLFRRPVPGGVDHMGVWRR